PGPGNYELKRDIHTCSVGSFSRAARFRPPREPDLLGRSDGRRRASSGDEDSRNPQHGLEPHPTIPKTMRPWQRAPKESPGPASYWNTMREQQTGCIQVKRGYKFGEAARELSLRSNML
ncbi:DUF4116 domain-containing protein, partial [Durusdinium trenchii]